MSNEKQTAKKKTAKAPKEQTVTFTLPKAAKADLEYIAAYEQRSAGGQIRQWLLAAIEQRITQIRTGNVKL